MENSLPKYRSVNKKGKGAENADKKAKMKAGQRLCFPSAGVVFGRRPKKSQA